MKVSDVIACLSAIAPPEYADESDPIGLQLGSSDSAVRTVILCVTADEQAVELARRHRAELIITHHPVIYNPLDSLADETYPASLLSAVVRLGVAVFSAHTNLDVAPGGVNDALAACLRLRATQPLKLQRLTHLRKLVTFVPPEHLETVRQAMCAAGAGQIGAYTDCTFRVRGTGTFLASEDAHPAVGRRGRLEQIDEYRLEAIVPSRRIEAVVQALVQPHPYEEPAYDIYPLEMYRPHVGHGRIGTLAKAVSAKELVLIVERSLRVQALQVYGSTKRKVSRVAVGAGSGDALAAAVREKEAHVFVTGEMRSHAAEALAASGVVVVTVGHRPSEAPILSSLARRLRRKLAGLRLVVV